MAEKKKKGLLLAIVSNIIDMDDEDDIIIYERVFKTRNKRKRICMKNYVEDVVLNYHLDDFKAHFRLHRSTLEILLNILAPHLKNEMNVTNVGKPSCDVGKQMLIFIWMLANQEVFRKVSDRFDVAKSTAWKYLWKISNLLTKLAKNYIKWPSGHEALSIIADFEEKAGFPGVISAVDGTHIPICTPKENSTTYLNRKKIYSIVLQVACTSKYILTDCFTGYPGSVHDARLFKNSDLCKNIFQNSNNFPIDSHLLGDSAYKNQVKLLTPYKDNGNLTRKQKKYNYVHSVTRVHVEQTIGLLKGRFRCLKYLNVYNTKMIPNIIMACCVLHNICMKEEDEIDSDIDRSNEIHEEYADAEEVERDGSNKRDRIANLLDRR